MSKKQKIVFNELEERLVQVVEWAETLDRIEDENDDDSLSNAFEAARESAVELVDALREALKASDEPRTWVFGGDSEGARKAVLCPSEVVAHLESLAEDGDWGERESTIWVTGSAYCVVTDEEIEHTTAIDPPEPDCDDGQTHDWQSPHSILGGLEENPGVQGNGGGVIIEEVCMICGCSKTTDTWAQNPENGEQGLTSVEYDAGRYRDEIEALREEEADEEEGDC